MKFAILLAIVAICYGTQATAKGSCKIFSDSACKTQTGTVTSTGPAPGGMKGFICTEGVGGSFYKGGKCADDVSDLTPNQCNNFGPNHCFVIY